VNTATDLKHEGDSKRSSFDRRRGITLVSSSKPSNRQRDFSISVSSEMFSSLPPKVRTSQNSQTPLPEADSRSPKVARSSKDDVVDIDSSTPRLLTAAVVAGAVLIGYLVGRKRD
jgi:hypothetical protein